MMFFNFLNFFAIFVEFRITGWVGMDQNEIFFSLIFSASPVPLWLEKKPYWCFFNCFCYFSRIPYSGSGSNGSEREFFFSLNLSLSHPVLGRNIAIIMFFNFLHFFGIPYSVSGWNGSEREFFFSLILSLSRLILAWNEATMMFSDFLNFFAIFLEFLILGRVGMDRNENFFFLSFSACPV